MSLTKPICDDCWVRQEGERTAFRLKDKQEETCFWCKLPTKSGIYKRYDPLN